MAKTQAITAPTANGGHGAYNRSSQVQAAGLSPAMPLLEKAAKQVPLPPLPQPIVVAERGWRPRRSACGFRWPGCSW